MKKLLVCIIAFFLFIPNSAFANPVSDFGNSVGQTLKNVTKPVAESILRIGKGIQRGITETWNTAVNLPVVKTIQNNVSKVVGTPTTKDTKDRQEYNLQKCKKMDCNMLDSLFFSSETSSKIGRITLEHEKVPLSYYSLDLFLNDAYFWQVDDAMTNGASYLWHQLNNILWYVVLVYSRFVAYLLTNALTLDLVNEIGNDIGSKVQLLAGFNGGLQSNGIFPLLLPMTVVCFGLWIGWKAIAQEEQENAMKGVITTIVVIFAGFSFIYYCNTIVTQLNSASMAIRNSVLSITPALTNPKENYTFKDSIGLDVNNLWNTMVGQPYRILQYGTTSVDPKRVDAILLFSQATEARATQVGKEVQEVEQGGYGNINMTTKSVFIRTVFIMVVLVVNLILSLIIVIFSFMILFYQLYFVFLCLWSPFAFALSVIPSMQESVRRWAAQFMGALVMAVGLGLFLSIYLVMSNLLYSYAIGYSYLRLVIVQILLVLLCYFKRNDLLQMVTAPLSNVFGVGMGQDSSSSVLKKIVLLTNSAGNLLTSRQSLKNNKK